MGKRGRGKDNNGRVSTSSSLGLHTSLSIREEATGRKQSHNPKSLLKLKHLQNLAEWASEFSGLGPFSGHSFAEFRESLGVPPDPSLFPCQRCETILQSGFNCAVRIEKNRAKRRTRCRKLKVPAQNNVVYTCHFSSHRNFKQVAPARVICSEHESVRSASRKGSVMGRSGASNVAVDKANAAPSPGLSTIIPSITDRASSLSATGAKLLDSRRRKRNKPKPRGLADEAVASSNPAETDKAGSTSKKRRTWSTVKEIAESEQHERNNRFSNFSISFVL